MAIIVNTNMTALKSQRNLTNATNSLNTALERMSTGLKINSAKDDAAGLYVSTGLETQIRGSKVAKNNIATGNNVLQIMESDLDNILSNLQRIRDLSTQAANSVYNTDAMDAMKEEVMARLDEIDRISLVSSFNGKQLLAGADEDLKSSGLRLQVGANSDPDANSITLGKDMFDQAVDSKYLGGKNVEDGVETHSETLGKSELSIREAVETQNVFSKASTAAGYIAIVDAAINEISNRKAKIGAVMNRLEAAETSLTTTVENNTAAKSTIIDADVAEESMNYTKAQILQQTTAALLVQANSLPSIALNLVRQ